MPNCDSVVADQKQIGRIYFFSNLIKTGNIDKGLVQAPNKNFKTVKPWVHNE